MRIAVLLILLSSVLAPRCARAQPKSDSAAPIISSKDLIRLGTALQIEVKNRYRTKEISLSRFLQDLQNRLPKKQRIAIKLDAKAFGPVAKKVAALPLDFSGFPDRMEFATWLRLAASKIPGAGADVGLAYHPTYITVTTREAAETAQYVMYHDVSKLMKKADVLRYLWKKQRPVNGLPEKWARKVTAENMATLLAELIMMGGTQPDHWRHNNPRGGRLEVERDRLRIRTTIQLHWEIADLLAGLARMADLAVVVHSRLLQVDRGFYEKRLAPLFQNKGGKKAKWAVVIGRDLYSDLRKQKPWRTAARVSLVPKKRGVLFSLNWPVSYSDKQGMLHLARNGFSIRAKAMIGAYEEKMRLYFTRDTSQLLKFVAKASGKKTLPFLPIAPSPKYRKSQTAARVEIDDLQPVLLDIDFPATDAKKKLVLLVCPKIWIDEEQELIQAGKLPPLPKLVAVTPKGKRKKTPLPKSPLPKTKQVEQILQALVNDVIKNSRGAFYSTPGDKRAVLVSSQDEIPWPRWFRPEVKGYRIRHFHHNDLQRRFGNRLLGLDLNRFSLKAKANGETGPIEVRVFNAGGSANGARDGGAFLFYRPVQKNDRWSVECVGMFNP